MTNLYVEDMTLETPLAAIEGNTGFFFFPLNVTIIKKTTPKPE